MFIGAFFGDFRLPYRFPRPVRQSAFVVGGERREMDVRELVSVHPCMRVAAGLLSIVRVRCTCRSGLSPLFGQFISVRVAYNRVNLLRECIGRFL